MRVLVIGSGAREHALLLALAADPAVTALAAAPGNAGTAAVAEQRGVDATDGAAVADLAAGVQADLVVIGPEAPLVAGVADAVRAARPFGVDTARGIESAPGIKDHDRLRRFVAAAREADT